MPDLVAIGRVVKPHGIRGEVAVDLLSDVPGRFDPGTVVAAADGELTVASSRPHQGRMLVRFEGVEDRSSAELLRGLVLEGSPADTSEFETYFAHELVGMAVLADDGRPLGTVSALIELPDTAGYDLLEVRRDDGSTWLLPAVEEYVEVGEDEAGTQHLRVVNPPEGLVEG